ncbi:DUF676-domain-containing protein [Xylariomycetidae sp. FL0641]|nr:DUF676-domain-containing protein [Xylariomycetidae sp. FL0641]
MLLLHQVGSVKIGEVVRYTVTYTPSHDRILPSPDVLHLRVRNTSPLPLRAAFVHGPYTLSISAYPSHYDPNTKFENPRRYGVPEFEPMLKAAGNWSCQLVVPDNIKESAGMGAARGDFGNSGGEELGQQTSASWVIEVASQVIFSSSASVGYEILLARDEKSLNSGSVPVSRGQAAPQPGKVSDYQQSIGAKEGQHPAQLKGVYSKALTLKVEDTASLWNTPQLPGWDDWDHGRARAPGEAEAVESVQKPQDSEDAQKKPKTKKVHLVVLTHGLHSNLGADMLYLKESIDATVTQAKLDAKLRKTREKAEREAAKAMPHPASTQEEANPPVEPQEDEDEEDSDDEEVIVRGFSGNATRTERGIKFLGKRLARYVLSMTYPDQPFLPMGKKAAESFAAATKGENGKGDGNGKSSHKHSTVHMAHHPEDTNRKFQITSISFIGHSLGGLIQTYAIAYIQKHSPRFFNLIRPINFICLASPLLGLSNENPLYVKFALDFGLVGRTGQDLGLTWRAPTIARSGWGAIVGTLGESAHKKVMGEVQPESKPLLRILPTGPAHTALKKFRNRTVYSNVVNDGIVPLRTSCLLFLDWQGLGRVEKARREAGLVETVVGFGWAELSGANASSARKAAWAPEETEPPSQADEKPDEDDTHDDPREVPQPPSNATDEDDRRSLNLVRTRSGSAHGTNSQTNNDSAFSGLLNFFRGSSGGSDSPKTPTQKTPDRSPRESKIYKRGQTLKVEDAAPDSRSSSKSRVSAGQEMGEDDQTGGGAPPKTTFFESATDILNPNLPPVEYLIDPSKRPRTIFHDRIYHPSDIPPPPLKKRPTGSLSIRRRMTGQTKIPSPKTDNGQSSSSSGTPHPSVDHMDSSLSTRDYDDPHHTDPDRDPGDVVDSSSMRVEEKIARAYHRDLSWRKVLVKLEPDAHNNIIVRRMFANAYGWPVIKHLVDAHFSDSATARMRDEDQDSMERAKKMSEPPDASGGEVVSQKDTPGRTGAAANATRDGQQDEGYQQTVPMSSRPHNVKLHGRTASEALEAADAVPDLPIGGSTRRQPSHRSNSSLRSDYERADSGNWSDRDFADSGDESEIDMDMGYGRYNPRLQVPPEEKEKDKERSSSPVWNWTEKIVGKGSKRTKGPHSPTSPQPSDSHTSESAAKDQKK